MAFCTQCGASVSGTFCSQCGTPVAAAGGQPPAPPPPPAAAPYGQPVAVPVARKTSPIVWVLVIVLGFFVLGGIAVIGTIGYFAHRVRQAVQVNGRDGGFSIKTRGADGKDATIQFGGTGKIPSWIPSYPGSEGHTTFAVTGSADEGEGGAFSFNTSDDPERVKTFYTDKCKDMGMAVSLESTSNDGGLLVAQENGGDRRSLTVTLGKQSGQTNVAIWYGRKR